MPDDTSERVRELAGFLRGWADLELRGYAPIYDRIARALAEDEALLARVAGLTSRERLVPVLLFAAVHDLVLRDPTHPLAQLYAGAPGDAWPTFRTMVEERFDEMARIITARAIQTNEVGRASAVYPALGVVAAEASRPLSLVEVGASAGLNLLLDRFAYDYGAVTAGDPESPVRLTCRVDGSTRPPVPQTPLPIAERVGIDRAPVDVRSDDACRWLEACVWPGIVPRAARLRAAITLARAHPPRILEGDATALLPSALDGVASGAVPCIVSTWVLAYLSPEEREKLAAIAAAASHVRDVYWITLEYVGVPPWLPPPPTSPADEPGATNLLSLTRWRAGEPAARSLAWVHAHGVWLAWLECP